MNKLFLFIFLGLSACAPAGHFQAASDTTAAPAAGDVDPAGDLLRDSVASENPNVGSSAKTDSVLNAQEPDIVVTAPRKQPAPVAVVSKTSTLLIPAWKNKPQGQTWTQMTLKALRELGPELVRTPIQDADDFCPGYTRLAEHAREAMWVQLISAMVHFESNFKPWDFFVEKFRGSNNLPVVSRGLLQISRGSANLYGCNIKNEKELEDPETNLRCGVRIINTLVTKYHAIHGLQPGASDAHNPYRGAARYWSVLRSLTKKMQIRAAVRALPFCRA